MGSNNRASLVLGILLVALGVLFLVDQVLNLDFWDRLWPFTIMAVGGLLFVSMFAGGRQVSFLAIPASIVTMVGLILFTANLTNRWEMWAYAWTLILTAVGVGIAIHGWYGGDASARRGGLDLARLGLVLFVVFAGFFELIIFGSGATARWAGPALLIALGLLMLLGRLWPRRAVTPPPPPAPAIAPEANKESS